MNKLMVINAGSSSMKFSIYSKLDKKILANGIAERIFTDGKIKINVQGKKYVKKVKLKNHELAIKKVINILLNKNVINSFSEIIGIGHRVVQGGEFYSESILIGEKEIKNLKKIQNLAPLHNPANINAIIAFKKIAIHAKHVAVFDTAFHQTIPKKIFIYGVPYQWYIENKVRKYGMHGTSHKYITLEMQKILNKDKINIISMHLGNGASITAIKNSKSYNTSMGLTPLAGIIMGTRSGDIDPAIIEYMCKEKGETVEKITSDLNKKSGVLGLSGISSDFRDLAKKYVENSRAKLALEIYAKRVADVVVQYQNDLENKLDAIVFTAGIGENSSLIREMIIKEIHTIDIDFNFKLNKQKNKGNIKLSKHNSKVKVFKIPTNEELMILNDLIEKANL